MSKRPRSSNSARRASFGRAERLRREAGDTRQPKPDAPRKEQERPACAEKEQDRPRPTRTAYRDNRPTPLQRIEERLERSRTAAERRRLDRLEKQTRSGFNRTAERRRDPDGRVDHDRKRELAQRNARRIEEHQRRSDQKRLESTRGETTRAHAQAADRRRDMAGRAEHERKQKAFQEKTRRTKLQYRRRDEMKRAFNRTAERRRDEARRIEYERVAARQAEMQRRAAQEIDRDQKRCAADQKAAQQRQLDQVKARHQVARNSFRVNENTAEERHHHAIKGIDAREDRELGNFDGRRKGLAGRAAELIPGRRAENDQKRANMVRGYESERLHKHRDFEAFKERVFAQEQRTRLVHALERKALMELHRSDRDTLTLQMTNDRPRLIENLAYQLDKVEQVREQAKAREQARQEQPRENVRPSGDFGRAASDHAHEPPAATREFSPDEGRKMVPPADLFRRG